jgi:hypothetical protein
MTEDEREIKDLEHMVMDVKEPQREPIVEEKIRQFNQLSNFLGHWFYKPDMDAVKICLSTYVAHRYLTDNPVWLFIIGPPGSGKTAVAIKSVGFLPNTHSIADLTPQSFLSGFGENNGILGRLTRKHNSNGVLLFPDFTSLLAKKEDTRNDIVGQMRHIYDGKFTKDVGSKGESIAWKGKVTCLAAVTPALEDYWAINRSLGERFIYLRWNGGGGMEAAKAASRQVGKEEIIEEEFQRRILEYVDCGHDTLKEVVIDPKEDLGLFGLSQLVSRLRTVVRREQIKSKRTIISVDEPEVPTRISKMLTMIARGSATLDRRAKIDYFDLELAKRVAIDSIPINRGKIIRVLLDDYVYESTLSNLMVKTGLCRTMVERTIEDLLALKIIRLVEDGNKRWAVITEEIRDSWEDTIVANIYDDKVKG